VCGKGGFDFTAEAQRLREELMDINQRTHEVIGAAIEFNVLVLTEGIHRRVLELKGLCVSASLR
jgi:hypothetical protein